MKPKTATQRLAFKIAEDVAEFLDGYVRDGRQDYIGAEELFRTIYYLLPDDEAYRQAIEEVEEMSRHEMSDGTTRCGSILNKLREVLHAQEGYPIGKLIELAAQRCERAVELEEACNMLRFVSLPPNDISGRRMWEAAIAILNKTRTKP